MRKQFGILGLGHFGEALALQLSYMGADVIAVDSDIDKVQNIANDVTYAVQADVSDINALRSIGIRNVDVAVISITSNINANLMGILNCQELGVPKVYSKTNNVQHQKVLERLGVTGTFNPERDTGLHVAQQLYGKGFFNQLDLNKEYSISEISALKNWYGKTLTKLDLRGRYGVNVISITHSNGELNISPIATDKIEPGDKLTIIAKNEVIHDLQQEYVDNR